MKHTLQQIEKSGHPKGVMNHGSRPFFCCNCTATKIAGIHSKPIPFYGLSTATPDAGDSEVPKNLEWNGSLFRIAVITSKECDMGVSR